MAISCSTVGPTMAEPHPDVLNAAERIRPLLREPPVGALE